ncbi:MAG: lysostaphin resistance A-like protein [Terriglobia bacterium]
MSENHEQFAPPAEPPPRDTLAPEPWTYRDLVLFLVAVVVVILGSNVVALAIYAALRPVVGWRPTPEAITHNTFFLLATQFLAYILLFAYIYFLVVVHYRMRFWNGIRWGRLTRMRVLHYIGAGILITIAVQVIPVFLPDKTHFPLQRLFSSQAASIAVAVFAVVIAPFMEELIFRGVLFSIFEVHAGLGFAIGITAVLFAAMHIPEYWGAWDHVFLIFLVGLAFSITRGVTRSLAPSVVMHVTYNACLMIGLLAVSSQFRAVQSLLAR